MEHKIVQQISSHLAFLGYEVSDNNKQNFCILNAKSEDKPNLSLIIVIQRIRFSYLLGLAHCTKMPWNLLNSIILYIKRINDLVFVNGIRNKTILV